MNKNFKNLVFDYDGTIRFRNEKLKNSATKWFLTWIKSYAKSNATIDNKIILFLNSLRGISAFGEELISKLAKADNRVEVYLAGCNGSFIYDLSTKEIILQKEGLSKGILERIVKDDSIENILLNSGQNDFDGLHESYASLDEDKRSIIMKRKELWWDIGFPNSKELYKVAIDAQKVDLNSYKSLTDEFSDAETTCNITNGVIEITRNYGKGNIIAEGVGLGLFNSNGGYFLSGDQPQGVDFPMLQLTSQLKEALKTYITLPLNGTGDQLNKEIQDFNILRDALEDIYIA